MELSPWPLLGFLQLASLLWQLLVAAVASQFQGDSYAPPEFYRTGSDESLQIIHDVATGSFGALCLSDSEQFRSLPTPVDPQPFDSVRQKADMASSILQEIGVTRHAGLLDAVAHSLLLSDRLAFGARVVVMNASSGTILAMAEWRVGYPGTDAPQRITAASTDTLAGVSAAKIMASAPWYLSPEGGSPKLVGGAGNDSFRGWWTFPYYSCSLRRWLLSYSVPVPPKERHATKGFLSVDIDLSTLEINQCDSTGSKEVSQRQLDTFMGTHKCDNRTTQCEFSPGGGWIRGAYSCHCRRGYYGVRYGGVFNGSLVEAAWQEVNSSGDASDLLEEFDDHQRSRATAAARAALRCLRCAPGCEECKTSAPCLAEYNWPFRIALLTVSCICVLLTLGLAIYVFQHRRVKVFKVASPIFLAITLCGCAVMYLELAAIFPVLDTYTCIATKWSRHLGFCVTYTALLMKTWRVSLTYRVKSAHKVKLTDKQLLQWMFPILLVMLIFLGAWTLSAPPQAELIRDSTGLVFKQCQYNWWDHSISIGEVLFLAWGIKVCYNVRNAESLYNEARLISYAIYNIAIVNTTMVAFHLFIFPHAGPDIKYLLGFIRTQLSTSVTVALVFGPKVVRVLRGQGDQWDNRARARGVTASFSLNGIGLVPEGRLDPYQENEELKEEIQKMAGTMEYMKIVHMEMQNRHLKPKAGGYFSNQHTNTVVTLQSPLGGTRTTAGGGAGGGAAGAATGAPAVSGAFFRGRNSTGEDSTASGDTPSRDRV